MIGTVLKVALVGTAVREGLVQLTEVQERHQVYQQARDYADSVGKRLLVVGTPKSLFQNHPCGDVTIDIDPTIVTDCEVEVADVRSIPYPNHYFGAAFCSHVLEHLPTVEDAVKALDEMERVADKVFTVSPHKSSIMAWIHPEHHLWLIPTGDGYIIEQRGNGGPMEDSYIIGMQVL